MPEGNSNSSSNTPVPVGSRLQVQASSAGQPLAPPLLNAYRSQYGCDFPNVCIHPSHLATHVGGGACRIGNDIYFAPEIAEGTPQWKSLLDQNMADLAMSLRPGGAPVACSLVSPTPSAGPNALGASLVPEVNNVFTGMVPATNR